MHMAEVSVSPITPGSRGAFVAIANARGNL